jgi:hypothetical protein
MKSAKLGGDVNNNIWGIAPKKENIQELRTKLPAYINGEYIGDYTAFLCKDKRNATIVRIVPCEGTAGYWTYYLQSLLQIDDWAVGKPSDVLCIDLGQGWEVHNMLILYKEIINEYIKIEVV